MITREEAAALLSHAPDYWLAPGDGSIENVQGNPIAHVHEHANLRTVDRAGETHSSADARLIAAAPDLARTVVALYDERDALRAELDSFAAFHRAKTDALALELRRLRAAEDPGTDDEAFVGTGWARHPHRFNAWGHRASDFFVELDVDNARWLAKKPGLHAMRRSARLALDAMRAAVPGSV